jgi:hypothetical protein
VIIQGGLITHQWHTEMSAPALISVCSDDQDNTMVGASRQLARWSEEYSTSA